MTPERIAEIRERKQIAREIAHAAAGCCGGSMATTAGDLWEHSGRCNKATKVIARSIEAARLEAAKAMQEQCAKIADMLTVRDMNDHSAVSAAIRAIDPEEF